MSESDVGNGPNPLYDGCFEGETQELADLRRSQAVQIAALTADRDALTKALLAFRSAGIDLGWGAHPKWFHLIQRCDEALAARAQGRPSDPRPCV